MKGDSPLSKNKNQRSEGTSEISNYTFQLTKGKSS